MESSGKPYMYSYTWICLLQENGPAPSYPSLQVRSLDVYPEAGGTHKEQYAKTQARECSVDVDLNCHFILATHRALVSVFILSLLP